MVLLDMGARNMERYEDKRCISGSGIFQLRGLIVIIDAEAWGK